MNFPTSTGSNEADTSKHYEWSPDSGIWSEHSYGYTQSTHFRPFGNRAFGSETGVVMVEDPTNERDRSREPTPDISQLLELVRELKISNEELRKSNQILSQKLEQTNQLVQQGFRSIKDVISNIPGQINNNLTSTNVHSLPNDNDTKAWLRGSKSSSIISSLPEDLADEIEEINLHDFDEISPPLSMVNEKETVPIASDLPDLTLCNKEKFGFEYEPRLDLNLWLRK